MNASAIMVPNVITVKPDDTIEDVAGLLLVNCISAVPVVEDSGKIVGIVSEGDLLRRVENRTAHERPWWLKLLMGREFLAAEFIKECGRKVADVMTREVISAEPDTPVADIASLLERHRIKRVPIVQNEKIVGIVSRANLIQALAVCRNKSLEPQTIADAELREKLVSRLKAEPWVRPSLINVTVADGTVDLWGVVDSPSEKQALRVAVEVTPGVKAVNDNVLVRPAGTDGWNFAPPAFPY
jgi:CBS-domain-containing membrane protein